MSEPAIDPRAVAPSWGPPWLRRGLIVLATGYLASIWLDAAGTRVPERVLPRPAIYLTQIACLFPHTAQDAIDYRAEGYDCARRRYAEIDVRPFFPIHANDKESRFDRTMFFYRHNRRTMEALDEYITQKYNASGAGTIGGVLLLSIRLPIPPPGEPLERFRRRPLDEYPPAMRHAWYESGSARRAERCGAAR
ncbi:MAG TPA: hypothetical protein VKN99_28085 [Polyangia bacterium]|nr:hypothetical protein [Polyangia bacterium]